MKPAQSLGCQSCLWIALSQRERAGKENISNFWTAVNLLDDSMKELDLGRVEEKKRAAGRASKASKEILLQPCSI